MPLTGEYEPSPWGPVADQVRLYEESEGREGAELEGKPCVILWTRGRKSGAIRKTPLMRVTDGERYAVVASMGGAPDHPVWYLNLDADSNTSLQDGSRLADYTARTVEGDENAEWWKRATTVWPAYDDYQAVTDRSIPLVILSPSPRVHRGALASRQPAREGPTSVNTERSDSSNPDKVAARRESDRDYRMFLDAAPVGIAVIDQAGPVMMNQAAREILGQQPPDAPESGGKPDSFVLVQAGSGDLYPLQSLPLMRALLHGESTSARDLVVVRPDGELPVESWAKPILDREGNVRYAVAIVTDISERLEQERQLADAHVEVARANEELRDFSLLAAHDLAAPLRTIRGFAELLETKHGADLDADGERILHHICEEATRMQRLVESLVELSRADSASRAVARVDLDATVRGAVKTHQNEIDRVAAEIDIAPLPVVLGDKRQIAQVFENLVDNALKYRRAHVPLLVWVSATTQGDKIEIRVADNGRGVPPGEAAKIFVPLNQGTGAPPGHGLGLSICRRIVERHGGRMWAEPNGDAESNGSCFCITLPLADPEPSQP